MKTIIGNQFPKIVIPLIDQAKSNIDIIIFDWRWYPNSPGASVQLFNQAIVRAVRRGVRVRAIVNSNIIQDYLIACGAEAKQLKTKNLVHVKCMILDNKKAIVGSHNYTQNAFESNLETSILVDDIDCVYDYFSYFENLWQS